MTRINVTELRRHLPTYLDRVRDGEVVEVTRRGKVIARIVPNVDAREEAQERLAELRKRARIGDVESPIDITWNAIDDHP